LLPKQLQKIIFPQNGTVPSLRLVPMKLLMIAAQLMLTYTLLDGKFDGIVAHVPFRAYFSAKVKPYGRSVLLSRFC